MWVTPCTKICTLSWVFSGLMLCILLEDLQRLKKPKRSRKWERKRGAGRERVRQGRKKSGSLGKLALLWSPGQLKFCRYFKVVIYLRSTAQVRVHGCPRSPILQRLLIDSNQHLGGITRETKWGSRQQAIWSVIFNYPNDIHRQNLSHPSGQHITIDNVCLKTGL